LHFYFEISLKKKFHLGQNRRHFGGLSTRQTISLLSKYL